MISNQDSLSANKKALLKIRELKQQLAARESSSEPIAIVSVACRFPMSAKTPEQFWEQLISQESFVDEVPESRWDRDAFIDSDPETPGKMYTQKGVYLDDIETMDPEFFGISPREATWVDPQQRLLMETSWEAIERAGWNPEEIGSSTGVFIGWMHNDYQNEASDSFLNLNPYIATGAAGSFLCGRLAYYLGLNGPALAVDTACSSSLVALHMAVVSLQKAECDQAIVGGVNVICSPTTNILTCKLKALSPQGHSRAFDAAADGYLRGEGCGVVTLKRLSDAEHDGDRIIGVIRGSAVGHNGFSSGLTAPNPKAQEQVIRQALAKAQLSPQQISYLEAHGTGTELGDPLEVQAAISAYCQERTSADPLLIGSVKTNIGHLEAAAGMAGVIKVLLAFEQDQIPGQINFENPNPLIPWSTAPVKVLTSATSWPDEARLAGVSAFGMSGTNAHVILEGYKPSTRPVPEKPPEKPASAWPHLVTLSGTSSEALYSLAEAYRSAFADADAEEIETLAFTSNIARKHFESRAAIVVKDQRQTVDALRRLSNSQDDESTVEGTRNKKLKVTWQFTGQGSQYRGMAEQLYKHEPLFRQVIQQCDAQLASSNFGTARDCSLLDVLFNDDQLVHDTLWTQPALFAIQMGLAKLLKHWGVQPDFVMGHSVGQYAAACVAGAMTWETGLELISERGRLISSLPRSGKMLAVFTNEATARKLIDGVPRIGIGAWNASHIVLSGEAEAVDQVAAICTERKIGSKLIKTSHAFHSHLMDPVLEEFAEFASQFRYQPCEIPLACNLSGKILGADFQFDGRYWANHVRGAVAYQQGLESILGQGTHLMMELGPRPVLTRMARAITDRDGHVLVGCLDEQGHDLETMIRVASELYAQGRSPDFRKIYPAQKTLPHRLPTYRFQRRRFWGPDKPRADHAAHHTVHPLLGNSLSLANASDQVRYQNFVDQDSPSWMPDHQVMDSILMPGAAWVELAVATAKEQLAFQFTDLKFERPLPLTQRTELQTVVNRPQGSQDSPAGNYLESYSKVADADAWTRNFTVGQLESAIDQPPPVDFDAIHSRMDETVNVDEFYAFLRTIDLKYGNQFQTVVSLKKNEKEVLVQLADKTEQFGYRVSPTLLDGAFHSLAIGLSDDGDEIFVPVSISQFRYFAEVQDAVWAHATWRETEGSIRRADVCLMTESGEVLAEIEELTVQRLARSAIRNSRESGPQRLVHSVQWRKSRLPGDRLVDKKWLVIGASVKAYHQQKLIQSELESRNHRCQLVSLDRKGLQELDTDDSCLLVDPAAGWSDLEKQLENFAPMREINGVIWVLADDDQAGPRNETSNANCRALISLIQHWRKTGVRSLDSGLQLISENACPVADRVVAELPYENSIAAEGEPLVNPRQTQYWGLGRVLSAECPEYRCRLIDQDGDTQTDDRSRLAILADVILTSSDEGQIAVRGDELLVPRITRQKPNTESGEAEWKVDPSGAYLVTGGLGKLGRQAALWLAEKGAAQVILVSRRPPNEETQKFLEQFDRYDCEVSVQQADVSNSGQCQELFQKVSEFERSLKGVIHAAGVLDDGLVDNQTWERFDKVLQPKIDAAWNLHQFSAELELDFFILYSSVASTLGSPGQSNYATGNAYLDGLASYRRRQGLPAVALNWGPWTEGMADDPKVKKRLAVQGIVPLESPEAHQAMEFSLKQSVSQAVIIDIDWRKLKLGADGKTPKLLSELVSSQQKSRSGHSQLMLKLSKLPPAELQQELVSIVQKLFQEVIDSDTPPETDRPLIEMGLDSLMAVEFGSSMQMAFGDQFEIGPSILFDHPTIDSIAEYLADLIRSENRTESQSVQVVTSDASTTVNSKVTTRDDIAIIGMSCRFPGAANVEEYWQNLLQGVDSVGEIPQGRWDVDRFYSPEKEPGKMYTRQGGFLDDIDQFAADFFKISSAEAAWIDPQHRLLLENSYHALEDAGLPTKPLLDPSVGVFMGIMGQDYAFLPSLEDKEVIEGFEGAGLSHSAGVGRISYLLGLEGPSVAVDTASSSSLVAIIQAMRSLQDRNCNVALAGGVNAILAPVNSLLMSKAGLLSPDGRCKSFSEQADGFGRGEGCGVVVLKRLSDAERDQDRILAVLRGGAIGHNGFTGGLTTPSSKAQVRVIKAAVQDAGISPSDVQYLEAHGTGTEFGDPIELNAAVQIYGKGRTANNRLVIGSAKANIGHLEAAGGVSGLIKAVLSLHRGVIPPQIHFESPSPHIPWKRMPVEIPFKPHEFTGASRYAAVTALGLAGTNAHVLLSNGPNDSTDSHTANSQGQTPIQATKTKAGIASTDSADRDQVEREPAGDRPLALFISANSEVSLTELLNRFHQKLTGDGALRLNEFAYESGIGRRHFPVRKCVIAQSRSEAIRSLANLIELRVAPDSAASNGITGTGYPRARLESENGMQSENGMSFGHDQSSSKLAWYFDGAPSFTAESLQALLRLSTAAREQFEAFEKLDENFGEKNQTLADFLLDIDCQNSALARFTWYALVAKVWLDWGIEPDTVAGESEGLFAAACVAGVMDWSDAFSMLAYRYRQVGSPRQPDEDDHNDVEDKDVDNKAVDNKDVNNNEAENGQFENEQLEIGLANDVEDADRLQEFEKFADQFNFYPPDIHLICGITGKEIPVHRSLGGSYWREFLEVPTEAVPSMIESIRSRGDAGIVLIGDADRLVGEADAWGTLSGFKLTCEVANRDIAGLLLAGLARLYEAGFDVNYSTVNGTGKKGTVSLPNYPFEKKRYWITDLVEQVATDAHH